MTTPKSNLELYDRVDAISGRLSELGHKRAAQRLHAILHVTVWPRTQDICCEIKRAIQEILDGKYEPDVPLDLREELDLYGRWIDTVESLPKSSKEFYADVDDMSARLSALGHKTAARRLHDILHVIAFTTGNEVYHEIGMAMREILEGKYEWPLPVEVRNKLKLYSEWIDSLDYY